MLVLNGAFRRIRFISPWCACQTYRYSSMVAYDPAKIRNMALVAHIDSGKTTLTESILQATDYLSVAGSVDTGSTTTDFLPAERERGITIQAASIPVRWKDWTFNLIDTPGHADFGMEVESASRVVDGAVVLMDSVEGVEAQTKGVWRQLDRYGVPTRILFMNKMDRPGSSFHNSMLSILTHRLHPKPTALTIPISSFESAAYRSAEPGIEGLIDMVKWEMWRWNAEGEPSRQLLPPSMIDLEKSGLFPKDHPLLSHLIPARSMLLDNLAMFSEDLMETLLALPSDPSAYLTVSGDVIMQTLRTLTLRNDILPVLCGSAIKHIGTDLVLDYAGELLASPLDIPQIARVDNLNDVQLLAWKVGWDKKKGWMTFVRVYAGTLTKQSSLFNTTRNQREKASKLLLLYANEPEEVDSLPCGSVGVILGMKHTRTGDTLISGQAQISQSKHTKDKDSKAIYTLGSLRDITPPPAVMSASIISHSNSDLEPVQDALFALARTDPSVRVEVSEGQLLIHGLGALHLEIVEGRLRDEWGVNFETGRRRVSYRESFGGNEMSVASDWKTEAHGKPISVHLEFNIRPLQPGEEGTTTWDGNIVLREDGEVLGLPESFHDLLHDPWAHISRGIASSLSNSPNSSLPISNTRIHITSCSIPPAENQLSVLAGACNAILRDTLLKAGMGTVMEPYIRLKVDVTEEHFGKVIRYLTEHGGEVQELASNASGAIDEEDVIPYAADGLYIPPSWLSPSSLPSNSEMSATPMGLKRTVVAIAPLSKMLDFSNRLRALSGGHGTFEMANVGFKTVNPDRQMEILKEIGRA